MKVIEPSYRRLDIPEPTDKLAVLKHLEAIGRTCYKSEDKITDDSAVKYIKMIRDRKHWAMLEHYIFVMSVDKEVFEDIYNPKYFTAENYDYIDKLAHIRCSHWENGKDMGLEYIVSGSATAFNYLWESKCFRDNSNAGIVHICRFLSLEYPELMKNPTPLWPAEGEDNGVSFISRATLKGLPKEIRLLHDSMSVRFVVDRGVSHELVRHRVASWAQESTRYCNYSNDKFGNEISAINPVFFSDIEDPEQNAKHMIWEDACEEVQADYFELLALGATPQEARSVLPNSLKTEIVMTARMLEWRHFFDMRAESHAHPQMRQVVKPLLNEVINDEHRLFGDQLIYLTEEE